MSLLLPTVVGVIYSCYAYRYTRNGKHVTNQFCASTPDGCLQPPRLREICLCKHRAPDYTLGVQPRDCSGLSWSIEARHGSGERERRRERERESHHGSSSTVLRCRKSRSVCSHTWRLFGALVVPRVARPGGMLASGDWHRLKITQLIISFTCTQEFALGSAV